MSPGKTLFITTNCVRRPFFRYCVVYPNVYSLRPRYRLVKGTSIPNNPQLKSYHFATINPSIDGRDGQAANSVIADSWFVGDRERIWPLW